MAILGNLPIKIGSYLIRAKKFILLILTALGALLFSPIILAATAIEYGLIAALISAAILSGGGLGSLGSVFITDDGVTQQSCALGSTCNFTYPVTKSLALFTLSANVNYQLAQSYPGVTLTPKPQDSRAADLVANTPGIYQVLVNPGSILSITLNVNFTAPAIANAGSDQTVHVGSSVSLDGSNSTSTGAVPLSYAWSFDSKPAGSSAVLTNANAVSSAFTADKPGDYVVRLTVQGTFDNEVYSNADTVSISTTNSSPVADAGSAQTKHPVSPVTLDGTHSFDPDGDNISYSWTLQAPLGSSAILDNATSPTPSFTVDKLGSYTATLIVNDGFADSDPANVVISTSNSAPVANAGTSLSTTVGSQVALNGAGSADSDGDSLSYTWSFLSIPVGSQAVLSDIHSATPSFIADKAGTYVAGLVVNDGFTDSNQATVQALAIVNQSGVIQEIQDLQQYISSLNSVDFKNSNMQNTLLNDVLSAASCGVS